MHTHWKYPNLTLLLLSLVLTVYLLTNGQFDQMALGIGSLGYIGVFLAGTLFVSTFTVAPATALLYTFAHHLPPGAVAVIGGVGAALGDYLAYLFIRDRLFAELNPILKALHIYRPVNLLHTKYFAWLAPVAGAIVVASPLPDELGLSLLGLTRISPSRFFALALGLNTAGIYLIAVAANSI